MHTPKAALEAPIVVSRVARETLKTEVDRRNRKVKQETSYVDPESLLQKQVPDFIRSIGIDMGVKMLTTANEDDRLTYAAEIVLDGRHMDFGCSVEALGVLQATPVMEFLKDRRRRMTQVLRGGVNGTEGPGVNGQPLFPELKKYEVQLDQ